MAFLRWRPRSARVALLVMSCSAVACSSPTEPTSSLTVGRRPEIAVALDGTWEGTYRIARAEPANCGNLSGCPASPTLSLVLEQTGSELSGVLQLGAPNSRNYGRFSVKGQMADSSIVTLFSDAVAVEIPCTGRAPAVGETRLIEWSGRLMAGNSLVGTFVSQEFRLFNVGGTNLCPSGSVRISGEDMRLVKTS